MHRNFWRSNSAVSKALTIGYARGHSFTQLLGSAMNSPYVLVVDDNQDGREILSEYLRFRSISVQAASHGEEALQIAFANPPSVVLMDLSMPGLDGWNATRRLKADARTKSAIVVAVTAHAFPADRRKAMKNGADAFVPKPYNVVRLVDAVAQIMCAGRTALHQLEDVGFQRPAR